MSLIYGFHPIDTHPFQVGYSVLAAFVVVFGMFSLFSKEKVYIGEAVWATVFGILIGPHCAGIFNPRDWGSTSHFDTNSITIEVTRIVLAVGVFAVGVELPKAYVGHHWKSLAFLLIPIMTYGWFVCGGLIYAFIPKLDFLSSLAVAACLTPTDPILAAAVVGGRFAEKHVPTHLRHLLAAESGVNDGAAFPMLFIALYLILDRSPGEAVGHWFYITWVYEIILGTFLGGLLGYSARNLMKYCERHDLIDRHSYVAQYISLALLSNGITTILGSDDLLASFACGTAFAYDGWFNKKTEESMFSNVIDLLFNCACFIYIGAWIPFSQFNYPEVSILPWRLVVLSILVMLLRRIPIMIALYRWIPDIRTFREAAFSGHFGPMGVGAVFISTLALQQIPTFEPETADRPPETQLELLAVSIQPIVAFIVLCSIAVHGLSIPSFFIGRRVQSISRTWSRHTSMDPTGQPEWATQARRVTRPEDIIINRDPDDIQRMERGELKVDIGSGTSSGVTGEKNEVLDEDGVTTWRTSGLQPGDEGLESNKREGEMSPGDLSEREQRPGDVIEWREGHDLVIENKAVDGGEVDVEVVKNAFNDEDVNDSHIVPGAMQNVLDHVQSGSGRMKRVEEGAKGYTHVEQHKEEDVQSSRDEALVKNGENLSPTTSSPPPDPAEGSTETDDNRGSSSSSGNSPSDSTPARSRMPSPTRTSRYSPAALRPIMGRPAAPSSRRHSFRRRLFAQPKHLHIKLAGRKQHRSPSPNPDNDFSEDAGDEESGRDGREESPMEMEGGPDSAAPSPVPPGIRMLAEEGRQAISPTGIPVERSLSVGSLSQASIASQTPVGEGSSPSAPNPIILRQRLNQHLDNQRAGHRRSESPSSRSIRFADNDTRQTHQHLHYRHDGSTPRGRMSGSATPIHQHSHLRAHSHPREYQHSPSHLGNS